MENKEKYSEIAFHILTLLDKYYPSKRELTIVDLFHEPNKVMSDLPRNESLFIFDVIDALNREGLIEKGSVAGGLGSATAFYRDAIITPKGREYLGNEIKKKCQQLA